MEVLMNILQAISQFFLNSVEIRNLGLNLTTMSALLSIILSSGQMWGVAQQVKTINRRKSAELIITPFFIFSFFYLLVAILYGLYNEKLSIAYNGLGAFFILAVLISAWRYRKISRLDYAAILVFSLMAPLMVILPDKKIAYMSCAAIVLVGILLQLIIVIVQKKRGSLEPKMIDIYVITNVSWLAYGILTKDWAFELSSALGLSLLVPLSFFLRKYKDS